jgi:hypothetical protein
MKIVFDKILGMLREMDVVSSASDDSGGGSGEGGSGGESGGGSSSSAPIVVSGASANVVNGDYSDTGQTVSGQSVYSNGTIYLFQGDEDGMTKTIFADNLNNTSVESEGGYCGWIYVTGAGLGYYLNNRTFYAGIYGSQALGAKDNELVITDNRTGLSSL